MITSKPSLRSGFDCIIRPAPSGAGRTTPSQPGHYPLNNRTTPAWQLDHVKPAHSLKRHIMKIIIIIKIMITIIIKIIIVAIIIITTMTLSFNHGYHWRNGCPELNYVYPLWVHICLENAVKPQNNVPVWYVVLW